MADNFLEYHRDDYERRKAKWLAKQKKTRLIYLDLKEKTTNK